jgi:hypothetical protein
VFSDWNVEVSFDTHRSLLTLIGLFSLLTLTYQVFFDWSVEVNPHKPSQYALNLMQVC